MSDPEYDVLVVGFGMAGVTAAIEAADAGASVLVVDRGYGGGATTLSGGVVYAGGGTRAQHEGGVADSPENMVAYLRHEVGDCVSETTLQRFCEGSPEMIDWLEEQGAEFRGSLCPYKTSYPTDSHYLYYSGNEKAWPHREAAEPAPRGHRQVAPGMSSGAVLFARLRQSAERKGVTFWPLTRVDELLVEDGVVVGVGYRRAPVDDLGRGHRKLSGVGAKLSNWVPPVGTRMVERAGRSWERCAVRGEVQASAVILTAGGFMFDEEMKVSHGPAYRSVPPLGTAGDDGSGIRLGVAAGGSTAHLDKMSVWRFMSPPSGLTSGVALGPDGRRIAAEDLYGATHAHHMLHEHGGRGFLVLDSESWRKARAEVREQTQFFQRAQAIYLFSVGHKKASTLAGLARRIGVSVEGLERTVADYNDGIESGAGDPARKAADLCVPLRRGPFYAIDISIENSPAYPVAGITLGGLRIDEETGQVLREDDHGIPGLYAGGRTAVGLCSRNYVSGLSLADAAFSGRRAGRAAASSAARAHDDSRLRDPSGQSEEAR